VDNPFPSYVDIVYQAFYAVVVAALLLLPHAGRDSRERSGLLDALTVTAAVGLLAWVFLIGPLFDNHDIGLAGRVLSVSYPLWDVLILATGARIISTLRRTPAVLLLFLGCVGLLLSDVLFGYRQLDHTWQVGGPVDLGWFVFYAAWGAAALHPSM